jgi:hypothetical protein
MILKKPLHHIVPCLLLYYAITVLVAGCTKSLDLSSPEKNNETIKRAFQTKDFDLWLKCFQDEDKFREELIQISGKSSSKDLKSHLFKRNRLLESTVIEKNETSESEAALKIKSVLEKRLSSGNKYLVKSIILVKYIKIGNDWKVHSTEEIEIKFFKWVDGKYVPLENNEFKE